MVAKWLLPVEAVIEGATGLALIIYPQAVSRLLLGADLPGAGIAVGRVAGIAHAGWRGLAAGVIESLVGALGVAPSETIAYLGPGIGPRRYEVGEEVRRAFVDKDPGAAASFAPARDGKRFADLYALARRRLAATGVTEVYGGGYCTASEKRFFSFRRDRTTGRMASLVWLEDD